jgi:hypothetical protein
LGVNELILGTVFEILVYLINKEVLMRITNRGRGLFMVKILELLISMIIGGVVFLFAKESVATALAVWAFISIWFLSKVWRRVLDIEKNYSELKQYTMSK